MITLSEVETPAFLKIGFFGDTGSGKTFTAAKMLSQFIRDFCPEKRLAMFDTEPSAGYIKDMVKDITGKPLLAIHSRSFAALVEFANLCKTEGHVAWVDSITHPWRNLMADYLEAKKSRIVAAGGNGDRVNLTLKDWGPLKEMWNVFSSKFAWDNVHWCIAGRQGDVWETVEDEEGESKTEKTGVKMKTETETGFEPSLLIQMRLTGNKHQAFVVKDRFDAITGQLSENNPDIDFIMPHLLKLNLKGSGLVQNISDPVFKNIPGPNYETVKAQRAAILEEIEDDIMLMYPGMTGKEKQARTLLLRDVFGTSSWIALKEDIKKHPIEFLTSGRMILLEKLVQAGKKEIAEEQKEEVANVKND